jgi:hypothetical protein
MAAREHRGVHLRPEHAALSAIPAALAELEEGAALLVSAGDEDPVAVDHRIGGIDSVLVTHFTRHASRPVRVHREIDFAEPIRSSVSSPRFIGSGVE